MPRDSSGIYTLPSGNPVESGTIIQSTWANTTMEDIALALTNSLDRNGNGGMLAPFKFFDGTAQAPGATWFNEPNTGLYREGGGDLRMSVRAKDVMQWRDEWAYIWDPQAEVWRRILTQGGQGGVPEGDTDGEVIVWDESSNRWRITSDFRVLDTGEVKGVFRGTAVNQPESKILSVSVLPAQPDPNTLYLVRD